MSWTSVCSPEKQITISTERSAVNRTKVGVREFAGPVRLSRQSTCLACLRLWVPTLDAKFKREQRRCHHVEVHPREANRTRGPAASDASTPAVDCTHSQMTSPEGFSQLWVQNRVWLCPNGISQREREPHNLEQGLSRMVSHVEA